MPSNPIKLSPSDLTFLWDECPRCFYLKYSAWYPSTGCSLSSHFWRNRPPDESPIKIPRLVRSSDHVRVHVLTLVDHTVHLLEELVADANFPTNFVRMLAH
jgi:hypothetical protein